MISNKLIVLVHERRYIEFIWSVWNLSVLTTAKVLENSRLKLLEQISIFSWRRERRKESSRLFIEQCRLPEKMDRYSLTVVNVCKMQI